MGCPECGASELVRDTRDVSYTYKGASTTITDVTGDFCPACDEVILKGADWDRYGAAVAAFHKEINASIVDPGFILSVRKKLGLNQREAGQILGGGANAFSRYETGRAKPPLSLVQFFKVLNRHPELLDEVRVTAKELQAI